MHDCDNIQIGFVINLVVSRFFLFFSILSLIQLISDEELPFLTPYDAFVNEREADQSLRSPTKMSPVQTVGIQSSSKPPSSAQLSQNLGNLNLSYNISDEKLLTAAAQLVDVYNKRSKASAIITVQPKSIPEPPRNRGSNIRKQGSRSQFPLPVSNFVVTKITEKPPSTALNKCNSIKMTKIGTQSPDDVKPNRKQEEIDHTKRLAEIQRQKSLQIFNTYAPNSVKNLDGARQKLAQSKSLLHDGKKFQIKSLEMTKKNASSTDFRERNKVMASTSKVQFSKASEMNRPIKNEPVILNFRTKVHDQLAGPSKQPATLPKNGQTNSGAYRMLEITPLSKNVMAKSTLSTTHTDRCIANKSSQLNHIKYNNNKSVRPLQSMSVTKVYSRYPLNNTSRSVYHSNSMVQRARAPILKKYPSMSDLSQQHPNHTNRLRAFDLTKTFKRSNSCIALGDKMNRNFFDYIIAHSKECDKLYDLCSTVVNKLAYKIPVVTPRRKRGRPRKKVYASFTRELLNSADFSMREDIWRLHKQPFGDRILNSRRNKRFALLSIEPILPDISELNICKGREHSPVSSFQTNRMPLKTYSRANLIQPRATLDSKRHYDFNNFTTQKSQIQLLNIEPLSSSSQIDVVENVREEVSQSTEYIDDEFINTYEYDLSDSIYVEYLDENDEIESPAYEPHTSESIVKPIAIITGEADTTVENYNQQHHQHQQLESPPPQHQQQHQQRINWDRERNRIKKSITHNFTATRLLNEKGSPHIEIKYLNTNESDAHSTTDSITEIFPICEREEDTGLTVLPHILPKQKAELNLSPTRKSTRKRKIPNEFPNFAKKVRS